MSEPAPTELMIGPGNGHAGYPVVIGTGVLGQVVELIPAAASRVAVIHPPVLAGTAARLCQQLEEAGLRGLDLPIPDGEAAKDVAVAGAAWSALGQAGFTRADAVIGLGGGATTDLAGFVAATWLRGVPVIQAPSTLLGMVDAAIGGKTGIDTPEGKNLVGAFHPPVAVVCDLSLLATLPAHQYVSGLAEVIKAGFIADPQILRLVEQDPAAAATPTGRHTRELIERAIGVKAAVVAADLRDAGPREVLNYGHTLGHAIEKVESYRWPHGAAVSVGMVYAAELARLAGRLDEAVVRRHRAVLGAVGLPTAYRGAGAAPWSALRAAMAIDKKARGDTLRFIVLDDIGRPSVLTGPAPELLTAAFEEVNR